MKAVLTSIEMKNKGLEKVTSATYEFIGEAPPTADIQPWKEKRNISQNSKYWALLRDLQNALLPDVVSLTELDNEMIADYSEPLLDSKGNVIKVILETSFEWMKSEDSHYRPTGKSVDVNGKPKNVYIKMLGSSQMNTAQMAKLIDGVQAELENLCNL